MFLVRCPKCKNVMRYQPEGAFLAGKIKKCVYCGFSIKARQHIKRIDGKL